MDYSLAVGIDNYYDTTIDNTPYAEKDATDFYNVVAQQFELVENILLIGEEATLSNIEANLDLIISKIHENDRVFFFFAGHGSNVYNEPKLSCYDSKNDAKKNVLTWFDLNNAMGKIAEKRVNLICFIDACESSINYTSRGSINAPYSSNYIYVFSAANSSEKANSDNELKNGIWTYFLLEALRGNVDALINNQLTNTSLQNYLNRQVIKYYTDKGDSPSQIPQSWGKTNREFIIKDFSTFIATEIQGKKDIYIKDIYFGTVDADNEMKEEPQKFVKNYFDLNNVSNRLLNKDNMQFVIGRKGTGKTYIGMYMQQVSDGKVKYLAMDSFDYKSLNFLGQAGNGYEQYVIPWKYFLLSQLLIHISDVIKNDEITALLTELYGRKATIQQILHRKFKRGICFSNSTISEKWKKELAKDDDCFQLQELTQIFSFLIEDYITQDYLLILDGLDEKINENSNYRDMMNGLIWAIKGLNDDAYANKVTTKVVAFFRKDVFELVQGANTAKIAIGSTINLDWISDADDKKKYPLYIFMNIRYKNCLEDLGLDSSKYELVDILPEYMEVSGEKVETWDWILNFTTYKPRDVVKLLSECGKKCTENETKITEQILWEAQPEYSKYFIKELKNELYGFINEDLINAIFEKMQSMRKGWKDYQFLKTIISQSAMSLNIELGTEKLHEIIIKLYEVGVLGVQLSNEHEHWFYRRYMKINDCIEISKYKLHQGLWKELSIW